MTSRVGQPDTEADRELRELLDEASAPNFTMIAGAGSGKTTSLVKALDHVAKTRGEVMRSRGQRVACITYTEVAAREIMADVADEKLFWVSTIHSFLWEIIRPYQVEIGDWVRQRIETRIQQEQERLTNSRIQASTREKASERITRYEDNRAKLKSIKRFSYSAASSYGKGVLGHTDVIQMVPELIGNRPLLTELVITEFPFIFVDESQDTDKSVLTSLRLLGEDEKLCLGFFGDPMQRIFVAGAGEIPGSPGWREIKKPENFRSSKKVLELANEVRRPSDDILQVSGLGTGQPDGDVTFMVLPRAAEVASSVARVRRWLAVNRSDFGWSEDERDRSTKVLVIAHRMAARRLGFDRLFSVFNDGTSQRVKDDFTEGRAWPLTLFLTRILPMAESFSLGTADAMGFLRSSSPALREVSTGEGLADCLQALKVQMENLSKVVADGGEGSVGKALRIVHEGRLLDLDERWTPHLSPAPNEADADADTWHSVVAGFLGCDIRELRGYAEYARAESPYSTQQGVKGSEFPNVIVVLDDQEGRHGQFSYDKFIGIKPLSEQDRRNIDSGLESILDRTRRLLYVCCTRAKNALAIVLYADDVDKAVESLRASALPGTDALVQESDLEQWERSKHAYPEITSDDDDEPNGQGALF